MAARRDAQQVLVADVGLREVHTLSARQSLDATREWLRSGGPATEQFDMLTALVNWVEKGQAPDSVRATARPGVNPDVPATWQSNGTPRSRPLCPWPQQARYKGTGDVEQAASWACAAP